MKRTRAHQAPEIWAFIALLWLLAGCNGDNKNATSPWTPDRATRVGVVVPDFPRAPQNALLFAGEQEIQVDLDDRTGDTLWSALSLTEGKLQYVALMDGSYRVYGATLYTGRGPQIVVSAASTTEVPILATPGVWVDDPVVAERTLGEVATHRDFGSLVARLRTALQDTTVDGAFEDSVVQIFGATIVADLAARRTLERGRVAPAMRGTVSLYVPEDADDAGVFIRGPFGYSGIDLGAVPIEVINILPRYLIPCRVDYVRGSGLPLPPYRWPRERIPSGNPLDPSTTRELVDFESANLERVDLTFFGAGGHGEWVRQCSDEEDFNRAYLSLLVPATADFAAVLAGLQEQFIAWLFGLGVAYFSLGYRMKDAVDAVDRDEANHVLRETLSTFSAQATDIAGMKGTSFLWSTRTAFMHALYLPRISRCPQMTTYRMYARETGPPGDDEPTERSFALSWEDGGDSYVSYVSRVGQNLPGDRLGFVFDASENVGTEPRVLVWVDGFSEASLYARLPCAMTIPFVGVGTAMSPMRCERNGNVRVVQTYVTFLELAQPEGLFPGLASGYFSGELGFEHTPEGGDWWCESVTVSAVFDSVRVYAEPIGRRKTKGMLVCGGRASRRSGDKIRRRVATRHSRGGGAPRTSAADPDSAGGAP